MHCVAAANEAATQLGSVAAAELSPAAATIGAALRHVRESVRALVLRRADVSRSIINNSSGDTSSTNSSNNSSGSSHGKKDNAHDTGCGSISPTEKVADSKLTRAATHHGVRLVAVSKRQSAAAVAAAVAAGQRHFAENYVQELISKSEQLRHLNISWHMIGHLQSNKAKQLLAACPELYMVETVDSIRLAHILNAAVAAVMPKREYKPLRVLVQVNTSDEDSKSGLKVSRGAFPARDLEKGRIPSAGGQQKGQEFQQWAYAGEEQREGQLGKIQAVVRYITKECTHLKFAGLMTIGPPNIPESCEAFTTLGAIKQYLLASLPAVQAAFEDFPQPCELFSPMRDDELRDASTCTPLYDYAADEKLKIFELSMGMTSDYKEAIEAGSTEVRVGTGIFGKRC